MEQPPNRMSEEPSDHAPKRAQPEVSSSSGDSDDASRQVSPQRNAPDISSSDGNDGPQSLSRTEAQECRQFIRNTYNQAVLRDATPTYHGALKEVATGLHVSEFQPEARPRSGR
jgi:hypothetical protein